jgi:hypothetical protein
MLTCLMSLCSCLLFVTVIRAWFTMASKSVHKIAKAIRKKTSNKTSLLSFASRKWLYYQFNTLNFFFFWLNKRTTNIRIGGQIFSRFFIRFFRGMMLLHPFDQCKPGHVVQNFGLATTLILKKEHFYTNLTKLGSCKYCVPNLYHYLLLDSRIQKPRYRLN